MFIRLSRFHRALPLIIASISGPMLTANTAVPAVPPSLPSHLRTLDTNLFSADERKSLAAMLRNDVRARRNAANQRDREAWAQIRTRCDWEKFVRPRIEALRRSLNLPRKSFNVQVVRAVVGDGYRIDNLFYESRPGVFVTANLYLPSPLREKMPAVVIIHSHHNPKTQGELQDMGMTWARAGCMVLVLDQLSYGERRQHAAGNRQDYRFRYINAQQLHVIGESLIGWMARDIMRGFDVLMQRSGIDKDKIVLIGSVAGGGDPAAVAAALDPRIQCVVPFNFGGPQPETQYPLPDDAEVSFNYMGSGSWESTRNLRLSGRDGFLPWVIVASVAPRYLIHAHEFSWDGERDPVWKRYQRVFGFYNAADRLSFTQGFGLLTGQPPAASHCNNVGAPHRKLIHAALERWFGIRAEEYSRRRAPEELMCFPPDFKPRALHEIYGDLGAARATAFRAQLRKLSPAKQRQRLREEWTRLLGEVTPNSDPAVKSHATRNTQHDIRVESLALEVEPGIVVPTTLLLPADQPRPAVVVALAQEGKGKFLSERADAIAELLRSGVAVCLPDLRGTGETRPEGSRQYQSEATSISATELMLGQTLLGSRLRDLRSVLRYLRTRSEVDAKRIALWGDSFAPTNPPDFPDPLIGEGEPSPHSEPLGGILALLGALYEDDVRAVVARGTLAGYQSVLRDRFCYVPHDAIVPGALTAGDLCDVAAALAPRPLWLDRLVDGRNAAISAGEVRRSFVSTIPAYRAASHRLMLAPESASDLAAWIVRSLK